MFKPQSKISIFHHETQTIELVTTTDVQYFEPDQTYDLWEHKPNKRGEHLYFKIGERNCRESYMSIHFGTNSFMSSMAKVITLSHKLSNLDQIICSFTGFDENCPHKMTVIYDCGIYLSVHEQQMNEKYSSKVVDDMELLLEKYNAL